MRSDGITRMVKELKRGKRRRVVHSRLSFAVWRWLLFLGQSIANRLAWRTNGLGALAAVRNGDGGPGAAGAERISCRRKSNSKGPVERAAEALGRRASHAGRDRPSTGPQDSQRCGQCGEA